MTMSTTTTTTTTMTHCRDCKFSRIVADPKMGTGELLVCINPMLATADSATHLFKVGRKRIKAWNCDVGRAMRDHIQCGPRAKLFQSIEVGPLS